MSHSQRLGHLSHLIPQEVDFVPSVKLYDHTPGVLWDPMQAVQLTVSPILRSKEVLHDHLE